MASKAESSPPFFLDTIQILSNNTELLETCKEVFTNERYKQLLKLRQCEITKLPQNSALLLPGNSFGFLSEQNGLHSKAIELYGESLRHEITSSIQDRHHGELLVGESSLLSFPNLSHYILYTPTSRIDSCNTSKMSVFLSTRAALRRIRTHNLTLTTDSVKINTLIVCEFPVLMPVIRIALQMKVAIDEILFDRCSSFKAPTQLPDPMSLEVALTRIKSSAELKANRFLKSCML